MLHIYNEEFTKSQNLLDAWDAHHHSPISPFWRSAHCFPLTCRTKTQCHAWSHRFHVWGWCAIKELHSYQLPGQSKPQLKYLDNRNLSWSAMQIFINVWEEVYHTLFTVGQLDEVVIFCFHTVWNHKNAGTCSTSLRVPFKTDFHYETVKTIKGRDRKKHDGICPLLIKIDNQV